MRNLLFCFGLLCFHISCNNAQATTQDSPKMSDYEVLYQSEYGGSGVDEFHIIDNQGDFARYWAETTMQPAISAKNFDSNKKMIITKSFKSKNSGGNQYEVQSVNVSGKNITVHYNITSSGDVGTMAITNPLLILLVDKIDKPIIEFVNN